MNKIKFFLYTFVFLFSILFSQVSYAEAATWYVGVNNALDDVATHGTDPNTPFATLAYAESQAADGDTVQIANGTYTETQLLATKSITWIGESKDAVIVRATNATRIIRLGGNKVRSFQNLTLQNNNNNAAGPIYLVEFII